VILTAYRLSAFDEPAKAFSGFGASTYGGRWNSVGTPVIYLSESLPLAAFELLAHLELRHLRKTFFVFEIHFQADCCLELETLPPNWDTEPPGNSTQQIGDQWFETKTSLALKVPSVIFPNCSNFIVNPHHPDYATAQTKGPLEFTYDSRLVKCP
jgi:RES domain-containing protein